ncbi:MAG: PadR family transcriptional regulator [Mycobacteriales bacterium]
MLELTILGFLAEQPLHGYQLRTRIARLSGHVRPVSDGSLYPAIKRMEAAGLLVRQAEQGTAAAPRQVLSLTGAGRAELLRRLRDPEELEITDRTRFFAVLAFLHLLPDPAAQAAVLRRRLAFLDQPASYFHDDGDRPVRIADLDDQPFRRGMLVIARATRAAEREWLHEALAALAPPG